MSFRKEYTQLQRSLNGFYQGRQLINSHTRINKGVLYVPGVGKMEATVVDFDKDSILKILYEDVLRKHIIKRVKFDKRFILEDAFNAIKSEIPYNLKYVEDVQKQYDGKKVSLGFFIGQNKGGVCRHQALASAAVLERMVDEKLLAGTARINWNRHPCLGGHAWAEYRTSQGEVVILDIAQDCCGYPKSGKWGYIAENQPSKFDL